MNYSLIREMDISNGPGVRVSLFCSGCEFHCKNCFNPQTWNFDNGKKFDDNTLEQILELMDKPYVTGLSLLGGEPLHPRNVDEIHKIVLAVKNKFPTKTIWIWSGFVYENLNDKQLSCVKDADVLVDGQFVDELKDFRLKYRGSSNQRVIDIKRTIESNKVIEIES